MATKTKPTQIGWRLPSPCRKGDRGELHTQPPPRGPVAFPLRGRCSPLCSQHEPDSASHHPPARKPLTGQAHSGSPPGWQARAVYRPLENSPDVYVRADTPTPRTGVFQFFLPCKNESTWALASISGTGKPRLARRIIWLVISGPIKAFRLESGASGFRMPSDWYSCMTFRMV